jgi:hypothetical protein
MARARQPVDEITAAQIDAAEAMVRRDGAVAAKKLVSERLTRRAEAELVDVLVRRGLERTPRVLRLPLEQQLRTALAASGELLLAGLAKQLAGVTSAEARRAALAMVRSGEAVLVKEGRRERLLAVDARTLDAGEIAELTSVAAGLKAQLEALHAKLRACRATKTRPGLALLRSDVDRWKEQARATIDDGHGARPEGLRPRREARDYRELLEAATRLAQDGLGLVFVPDLVGALGDRARAHALLRRAAADGAVELRPESGLDRLSAEERSACLTGPSGQLVSYVRLR